MSGSSVETTQDAAPDTAQDTAQDSGEARPKRWAFQRRLPLAEQIYADLRARIVSLELPPNQSLARGELSEHYGISQTPLRDALLKLEREGLVEIYPQSRTLVTRIDTQLVRETQFLRAAVEIEIAGLLAAEPDKSGLAPAGEMLERQVAASRKGDFQEFIRLDKEFHRQLFVAAGKPGLHQLIDERSGQLDRVRRFHLHLPNEGKMQQVLTDHGELLNALLASDVEAARTVMRRHLSGTLRRLDDLKAEYPDYFS
ncbi:transcriptional regulator, GntR family [Tistlia consotensis]|uniref:Transcriptional regulator, GntR family n=1 Tax=Tistlia consotensis USBA 355 TaxID=560819 RepID=A0A1Y6CTE0_9PROT|nr:GntR family transcriptional regulator [Tistlia consotensis]SMF76527.1 transcriptional regulator, GntR family [Tistlia consotensis USBA 355]SNS13172.1 transcriptional regulator, GntR family [Tistlia consotensis]